MGSTWGTLIVLVIVLAVVAAAVYSLYKGRKKGKHLCGGECSKCRGCH